MNELMQNPQSQIFISHPRTTFLLLLLSPLCLNPVPSRFWIHVRAWPRSPKCIPN
ncbi:hypothetical protein RchiOBHm_Chr1g0323381 [Rosa chinensis]|uniref:Uncharacterized protein n=1 Tax=Rosa chinensis TaxID=74649 RepID=A0A2P6S9K8_ROSCH|nr:hypothetical protein RchiOBHm_Chr1g0323381 [Rosa chinensis]